MSSASQAIKGCTGGKVTHLWYLEKILLGLIRYEQPEDYSKFDLGFEDALVFILYRGDAASGKEKYHEGLCQSLDDLCRGLFPDETSHFFLEMEYKIVGIVMNKNHCGTFIDKVGEGLQRLTGQVMDRYGIDLYFCVSEACHSFDCLSKAYNEATYTYTYYYIRSRFQHLSFYSDIKVQKCGYLDVPRIADMEKRYIGLITTHEFVKARQELLFLLETLGSLQGLYNRIVQTAIFDIVNMVLKGLSLLNQKDIERIFDKFGLIEDMLGIDSLGPLKQRCTFILDQLINNYDVKSMSIGDRMAAVRSYIQVHYANPDLSLNLIADIFLLSAQYLSKNFKEYNGTGAQDFIVRTRIDNAKKLIRQNESLSVAQVACETGFGNSQTFIRVFKRTEGITPGQFRDSLFQSNT